MHKIIVVLTLVLSVFAVNSFAQTDADREAIRQAALNYAEGFYEGNPEKMESALHPNLAKRISQTNEKGQSRLDEMSSLSLVRAARGGVGKNTPKEQQQKDVTIFDIFGGTATVRLEMRDWIDYMHIAKFNGKWVIVNVLWELKPKKEEKSR